MYESNDNTSSDVQSIFYHDPYRWCWLQNLFCENCPCYPLPSQIGKFDTETKETMWWGEENCWPSEPVFVPRPNGESEDDGERSFFCRDSLADDSVLLKFKSLQLRRRLKLFSPSLFVCRCGFISRYQLQPGPEVLHRGYWWPNIQGSRSSLHSGRATQGRARDFPPTRELVFLTLSHPQNKMALRLG